VLIVAAVLALLLAVPAQTVTTKYVSDLFVMLDGIHRVVSGQVPNRDFHTALGPLAYYVPGAGYLISGTLGAAIPVGMGALILVLAPIIAQVIGSRLHVAIALPFAAFLLLILAVPINLGEGVTSLSFTKFYNRIGWVALATLVVMYLHPRQVRAAQDRLDAICGAALTLVTIYTKATYGLAALAFLVLFVLLDPRRRRWAALSIGLILVSGLIVEAFWRSSMAHVADLLLAWRVDGGLRGTWGQIFDHLLSNLPDFVLLGLVAGVAVWRTRSVRDMLFYAFCAVAGFLIINQNFQVWGIITLHAAAAVAAETILRTSPEWGYPGAHRWSLRAGTKLLFLALVLPTIAHCTLALGLHVVAAVTRSGEELAFENIDRIRLAQLWTWDDNETATAYLRTVRDGAHALASLQPPPSGVLALDVANPFSAAMGLEPPRGDVAGLLWGRTMNAAHHPAPEDMFAGVQVVMEPRLGEPTGASQPSSPAENLRGLYGAYIAAHFEFLQETTHWRVHRRRERPDRSSCAAGCGEAPGPALARAAR
jgi:hypothetical protein